MTANNWWPFGREKLPPLAETPEYQAAKDATADLRRSVIQARIVARGIVPELKGLERALGHDD